MHAGVFYISLYDIAKSAIGRSEVEACWLHGEMVTIYNLARNKEVG